MDAQDKGRKKRPLSRSLLDRPMRDAVFELPLSTVQPNERQSPMASGPANIGLVCVGFVPLHRQGVLHAFQSASGFEKRLFALW